MRQSISRRLNTVFIGLAIVPLILVGVLLVWQTYNTQKRQALALQKEIAKGVFTEVTAFFEKIEKELFLFSKVQMLHGLDPEEKEGILKLLMSEDVFENIILMDNRGRSIIQMSRLSLHSIPHSNRLQINLNDIPRQAGEFFYSPVRFDDISGEPLITIAVPVFDVRTGELDGVLASEVRIKKIWNLIADMEMDSGQHVYIVDANGEVIAHRNPSVVLRGTIFEIPEEDGIRPGLAGDQSVISVARARFGSQVFNMVAEQAVSEAFALAINTVRITGSIVIIALMVAGALGFMIVRQIVRPIREMASTAQVISRGNLSQQVEVKSEDELGILAKAFNSMTTQLRSLIDNLEQRVGERTKEIRALQVELLQKERLAVLGRLTATIAHEIRNPLSTVNTSIFSIRTGMERDNQEMVNRALTLAERNIKRCDGIITELLDYTRKIEIRKELVDLDPWLDELLDEQPNPSAIQFHRKFSCGIPVPVDREYLRRAVVNVLVNAIQAIDEDDAAGKKLFVETGLDGKMVEIRIIDSGPGIPEDIRDKIFEPLFSTKGFGVGLGLTIVKDIIEKHEGNMEIQSRPGKGATVILRIPL